MVLSNKLWRAVSSARQAITPFKVIQGHSFGYPSCVQLPWDDFSKIFRGHQSMAEVPNGVEELLKISTF